MLYAGGYLPCGESVPVESDMLLVIPAAAIQLLQIYRAGEAFGHTLEYLPCALRSPQLQCLVTSKQVVWSWSL